MELESESPESARPPHIERLVDKAMHQTALSTKRSQAGSAQPAFKQYHWTLPSSSSPPTSLRKMRNRFTGSDTQRGSMKHYSLLPRAKSNLRRGLGVLLSPTDHRHSLATISWDKFKPIASIKPQFAPSKLISKLMLSGLIVRH